MKKCSTLFASIALLSSTAWADGHLADGSEEEAPETAAVAEEVDLAAAEVIFRKSCRACHGNKAQGVASYPKLSDKEPEYIAEKLRIYRSGERIGPNSILMIQHAKKLSDEDITNLSIYITTAFE
ncbi:c-type cytochrome [Qingshengfaniella alkalisoli]|uniref:C-type cytochrome n=1 Tax=Qingshengfaniella alkalisoli TaxID=2599296 RepID=A0A5B8J795_9RHOB|nr:c-type cytochrome [Qingshengfaniella alkalisoli]QDY70347.1 c-type cytochrome [Qingshengfaniella alkalisoli]